MDTLPLDLTDPAVQDYLSLVRLQVLTPLSLVINGATFLVCSMLLNTSIAQVFKDYPTAITPNPYVLGLYVLALNLGQVGYCILLVLAKKPETKDTLTRGVGMIIVIANFTMTLWMITWVLNRFWLAALLQAFLVLLLLYATIVLLIYHPPVSSRPLDTALIHAPLRFFFVFPFTILFPLCLFIALGWAYKPDYPGAPPDHYSSWHAWVAFAFVAITNLVGMVVIVLRRDIVWCVAAVWICISLWLQRPKPNPVFATVIAFTFLHPIALFASFMYGRYMEQRRGISLPEDDYEHPGLYSGRLAQQPYHHRAFVAEEGGE